MSDGDAQVIKTHKDLDVWRKAIVFVRDVYKNTTSLPKHEKFGLVSQIRRSAISIPSNIIPVKLL